jgi:hypothetical protein
LHTGVVVRKPAHRGDFRRVAQGARVCDGADMRFSRTFSPVPHEIAAFFRFFCSRRDDFP